MPNKDLNKYIVQLEAENKNKKKERQWTHLAWPLAILIVAFLVYGLPWSLETIRQWRHDPQKDKPLSANVPVPLHAQDLRFDAYNMCVQYAKNSLKAPASADFADIDHAAIKKESDYIYTVTSHVDSQNSYGAKIRSYYDCRLETTGGNNWILLGLTFTN